MGRFQTIFQFPTFAHAPITHTENTTFKCSYVVAVNCCSSWLLVCLFLLGVLSTVVVDGLLTGIGGVGISSNMILLLSLQYFEPNSSWYDTSMAQESKSKRNENSSASYTLRTHSSDFPADVSGSSESKPDCDNAITSLSGISCFRTNGWSAERIVSSLLSIVAIVMYLLADCLHPHSFYSPQVIFFCPLLIYRKTSHFLQLACW